MPVISNRLTVKSNAKINLALSVYGVNGDGYHNISSVMQTVSLFDTVTVQEQQYTSFRLTKEQVMAICLWLTVLCVDMMHSI